MGLKVDVYTDFERGQLNSNILIKLIPGLKIDET